MGNLLSDFGEFTLGRRRVLDLAVGTVVGAAFATFVRSFLTNLLLPFLVVLLNRANLDDVFWVLSGPGGLTSIEQARAAGAVTVNFGLFLDALVECAFVAFALFLVLRCVDREQQNRERRIDDLADLLEDALEGRNRNRSSRNR